MVGGNNEGKSSLLHAFAVWEFCKTFLRINRGDIALHQHEHNAGVGMSIDEFTPINIPELKYLWTNLKPSGGYTLSIKCMWDNDKFLEIGLALANDRLFVKTLSSNVNDGDPIPTIAYLPPFAEISDKEVWQYPAQRKKLIGRGLAGAVLRNTIIDMLQGNKSKRVKLKEGRTKIKSSDLKKIRETDPYEILNTVLFDTFQCQLRPKEFNQEFHQYIHVDIVKGKKEGNTFKAFPNYNPRDIMTEGSGFLLYTYALNEDIDVLLLDEPDAHLHCSLQTQLFNKLNSIVKNNQRQILVATHSTEIIKNAPLESIMDVNKGACKYVSNSQQIIKILSGLGSEYNPILDRILKTRRIFFVENESDVTILQLFAKKLGLEWPNNLTVWPSASKHEYRNHVIDILKSQVEGIAMLSLIDRDGSDYNSIDKNLKDGSFSDKESELPGGTKFIFARFRKWRRSEIENYLLNISVLARAAKITESEVNDFFQNQHGIVLPSSTDFIKSDRQTKTRMLFDVSGKEYVESFCNNQGIDKYEIVKAFSKDEICEDIVTILKEIILMANNPQTTKSAKKLALKNILDETKSISIGAKLSTDISNIKSKKELLGDIISLLQSPIKNVITCLKSRQNNQCI